jgi:hypothetical protein
MRVGKLNGSKHPDGSLCREGTQDLPSADMKFCCPEFEIHTTHCIHDLRIEYWDGNGWMLMISDEGGVTISFCPFCGRKMDGQRNRKAGDRYAGFAKR